MTSRQAQAKATQAAIIQAAQRLMREKDYHKITIAEIAKAAGVSVGAIYHYFDSKEDILLFDYGVFDTYVENVLAKKNYESTLDAIRELIFMQMRGADCYGHSVMAQTMRVQLYTHGKHVVEEERSFHVYLRHLVRKAIEIGELHASCNAEEVTQAILRAARGALFDWAMRCGPDEAYSNALHDLEMILFYYKANPPATPMSSYPIAAWKEAHKELEDQF